LSYARSKDNNTGTDGFPQIIFLTVSKEEQMGGNPRGAMLRAPVAGPAGQARWRRRPACEFRRPLTASSAPDTRPHIPTFCQTDLPNMPHTGRRINSRAGRLHHKNAKPGTAKAVPGWVLMKNTAYFVWFVEVVNGAPGAA